MSSLLSIIFKEVVYDVSRLCPRASLYNSQAALFMNANFMATSRLYQPCERGVFFSSQTRMIFIYETARSSLRSQGLYCKRVYIVKLSREPRFLSASLAHRHYRPVFSNCISLLPSAPFFPFSHPCHPFWRTFFSRGALLPRKLSRFLELSLARATPKMDRANGRDKTALKYSL